MAKRIGIYLVGLMIAAFGIALIILAAIGAGPWDTVAVGLNKHLGLTIGMWSIISQVFLTLLTWIVEKTRFKVETIMPIMIRSWFLDFWVYIVFKNVNFSFSWEIQLLTLVVGIISVGVGIGIYVEANFPKTPIDGLMMALHNTFGWSISISRILIEISGVVLGLLLGGPVGFGTLVVAVTLGRVIQLSNQIVKKMISNPHVTLDSH